MKNTSMRRLLLLSALFAATMPLASCGEAGNSIVLHVYSAEDYIDYGSDAAEFEFTDDDGTYTFANTLDGFEEYFRMTTGKKVTVVYDTYDTNETMYSSLQTGKTSYDLICASDYMCQKMMGLGMLQKIDFESNIPNYADYGSPFVKDTLASITAEVDGKVESFGEYAIDYMWGTLGILYNPEKVAKDKNMDVDEVKFAMNSYDALWDSRFANEMSVKDSMRDTYAIGIMKTFDQEIREKMTASGYFDEDFNLIDGAFDDAMENYKPQLTEVFNRCDEKTVSVVKDTLLDLKKNVFGFEVDSGKEDIVKGLVGMNLAWSGDAVFAISQGEKANVPLYYSLPETGGNSWFDCWVMPKECEGERREAAFAFLDFLSHPDVASANMDYVGYTSCIAGDTVLDLIRGYYDPRYEFLYLYDEEEGEYAVDDEGEYIPNEGFENGDFTSPDGVETWDAIAEEEEWSVVDLTYMFEGSLSEDILDLYPDPLGDTPSTNPYLFYSSELEEIEIGGKTVVAGREFAAQYPDQKLLPKLAIMADYGANNKYVLQMWEDVKANNLPIALVIVFAAILVAAIGASIYVFVLRRRQHRIKVERRKGISRSKV